MGQLTCGYAGELPLLSLGGIAMETRWLYLTSEELEAFRNQVNGVCVIPMGAIEKHGLHLPLGTDTLVASHVAHEASLIEPVCIFPDFPYGDLSSGHPSTPPGTISLPMETELLLLEQLCDQIGRYGFQKILIYNGHGGNNAMLTAFMERLGNKKKNYVVTAVGIRESTFYKIAQCLLENGSGSVPELMPEDEQIVLRYYHDKIPTGHACHAETSFLLGTAPNAARLDRLGIESGKCRHITDYFKEAGIEIRDGGWFEDYPNSFAAEVDPVDINERIGKATVRFEAQRLANAYKVLKNDENLLKWQAERQKDWQ